MKGDRAFRLANLSTTSGQYEVVYAEISEIEGALSNGESVQFNRTSGKVLLTNSLEVEDESSTEFVFNLAVSQTADGCVLPPNPSESGTNVPFVDIEQEGENMHIRFVGDVTRGEEATIEVTDNQGNPVEGATVEVNGEDVAVTDADGRATFTVPSDDDELEVIVEHDIGEASIEYDFGDSADTPDATETPEESETPD